MIIVAVDSKHIHKSKESAIEAEVKAAKERAVIPLDVRMTQFRELLAEKQVCCRVVVVVVLMVSGGN